MFKKKNAVMVADTRNALVGTLLINLQETNPGLFDEAIIYHMGISEQDKNTLSKIMTCRFVEYNPPFSKEILELEDFKRFSVMMFCRYEMFKYLKEFETITWTDTDILWKGDMSPVIRKAKEHGFVAQFESPEDKSSKNTDTIKSSFHSFDKIPDKYNLSVYNICSGFIVLSDLIIKRTNPQKYIDWCYSKTIEFASDLNSPDQGVLNLLVQEFKIDAVSTGENGAYSAFPWYHRNLENAKSIHSWGLRKYWNSWYLYNEFPEWGQYYKKWVSLGGTDIFGEIKPSVSVVIPSYKPNIQYLKQVLDCLLIHQINAKQPWIAFDDIEVILVLEPVETLEVEKLVQEYNDKRLILHINESRFGIAKSINTGMKLARGKYILRMDDDDLSADTRIYKQKVYLDTHPDIELVTCDYEYFGDMNERRVTFEGERSRAWSLVTCPFDHPTIMFRKDFFEKNNLWYDEERGYVEDWELWLRAFKTGMRVGCIHEVLFWHRWHNGSAGQNDNTPRMMRELVKKNFSELGVDIPDRLLPYVAPWQGKIISQFDFEDVLRIYTEALKQNEKLKLYEQSSLLYIFSLRIQEAITGRIDALVSSPQGIPEVYREKKNEFTVQTSIPIIIPNKQKQSLKGFIKNLLKRLLRPIFKPIINYIKRQKNEIINSLRSDVIGSAEWIAREVVITRDGLPKYFDILHDDIETARAGVHDDIETARAGVHDDIETARAGVHDDIETARAGVHDDIETARAGVHDDIETARAGVHDDIETARAGVHDDIETARAGVHDDIETARAGVHDDIETARAGVHDDIETARAGMLNQLSDIQKNSYNTYRSVRYMNRSLPQKGKTIYLIGTPEYSNIGDSAICLGTRQFIEQFYPDYALVELSTYDFNDYYSMIARNITNSDMLFLQGGGNLGNRYLNEENVRRRIIKDFPNNKIVILPQTIYFEDSDNGKKELAVSSDIYNAHKNLTILTRGEQSANFARKYFANAKIHSFIDMALMLNYTSSFERKGILLCIRDLQDESGLSKEEYDYVVSCVKKHDDSFVKTNNLNNSDTESNIYRETQFEVVTKELQKFASKKLIVTDRLHGLIFAMVTHTPCVVISAYNYKISEFCELVKDSECIFFINKNLEFLDESIEKALKIDNFMASDYTNCFKNMHIFIEKGIL